MLLLTESISLLKIKWAILFSQVIEVVLQVIYMKQSLNLKRQGTSQGTRFMFLSVQFHKLKGNNWLGI